MADPIDLNNLEDEIPAAPPVETPPAPVAETPPAPPIEVQEEAQPGDDPRAAGLLAALKTERKQRQDLEKRAQRADELERWAAEKAPYITVLEQNPDLFKRPQAPTAPVAEPDAAADPDALEAAKLMDFYTPEGKPDANRGAQWLKLQDRRAGKMAQQAVQPWQDATMQERANQNFYRVLQVTTPTGAKASEQAVRAIWQKVMQEPGGMRTLANPESAAFLSMAALGVDAMMRKAPAAPTQDPVVTEASGGSVRPAQKPISALEEKILKNRGVSATAWAEHTKGFVPGRPTSMEED